MKVTKFSTSDPIQQAFGTAVKRNVYDYFEQNQLSVKGDWTMALKSVIMLSLYLAPFFAILSYQ